MTDEYERLKQIAAAAGLGVEVHPTNPPKPIGVIKLDADRHFSWGIPMEEFKAIVAAARQSALEEAARICDETWVSPGDLQCESCHEAAAKIRALASTEQAERNEGEKR